MNECQLKFKPVGLACYKNLDVDHIIRRKRASERASIVSSCLCTALFIPCFDNHIIFVWKLSCKGREGFHVIPIGKTLIQATSYNYSSSPS